MGKIAVDLEQALVRRARTGAPGRAVGRRLAEGDGWTVDDVICSSGPQDRPFEEQHDGVSIAVVAAGTFRYRTAQGQDLMTPGSLLLGNHGQCFECGHEHGEGDRCFSFHYRPELFDQIAADSDVSPGDRRFRAPRFPALREMAPLIARIFAGGMGAVDVSWEELSLEVAAQVATRGAGLRSAGGVPAAAVGRVARTVRVIEHEPGGRFDLGALASQARLSRYHFLRTFERVTGVTPHQFILRARLRDAAVRLARQDLRVIDVALESGFGDVSNFNHTFRAEFGMTPIEYRRSGGRGVPVRKFRSVRSLVDS